MTFDSAFLLCYPRSAEDLLEKLQARLVICHVDPSTRNPIEFIPYNDGTLHPFNNMPYTRYSCKYWNWGEIFILDFRLVFVTSDIRPARKALIFLRETRALPRIKIDPIDPTRVCRKRQFLKAFLLGDLN